MPPTTPPAVARVRGKIHTGLYRLSGGRFGRSISGVPVVLVTHIGRRTGAEYTTPLMKIEFDGAMHIIASAGGSQEHPAWYRNVHATPVVTVEDGSETYHAKTIELEGDERDRVYEAAKQAMDNFVGYEQQAGRTIPVIRLERAD